MIGPILFTHLIKNDLEKNAVQKALGFIFSSGQMLKK